MVVLSSLCRLSGESWTKPVQTPQLYTMFGMKSQWDWEKTLKVSPHRYPVTQGRVAVARVNQACECKCCGIGPIVAGQSSELTLQPPHCKLSGPAAGLQRSVHESEGM
ncbi:hypothetical protein RRG08_065632 [Elysia crispata]|uniref:Uncharacterized protein n=1 Tax=Elysia crispata TaxID=231223 RepID=A0AAE0YND0_9GAST|nr:hypothetical protein RRG08_065632 [Elysia crispata]